MYLVVGAGVVGASCAFHLARSGVRVRLVDDERPGRATAAGAGIVSAFAESSATAEWDRFGMTACRYHAELDDALRGLGVTPTGRRVAGQLLVARDPEDETLAQRWDRFTTLDAEHGSDVLGQPRRLTRNEIQQLHPGLDAGGGIHLDRVAQLDGRQMQQSLLDGCRAAGVDVRRGTVAPRREAGGAVVVSVDGHDVRDDLDGVVVAGGAWIDAMLDGVGAPATGIYPQRGCLIHLQQAGIQLAPIVTTIERNYVLTWPDGRVTVGTSRDDDSGFDHEPPAGSVRDLLARALTWLPALAAARFVGVVSGLRPATRDQLPVLRRVPDSAVVAVGGLGHYGLTLGPYVGKLAADWLRGVEDAPHELVMTGRD